MATQVQELWFSTAVGKRMDPDRAYGLQCVDVVDHYAEAIFPGVRWQVSVGGVVGAKQLLANANRNYWTVVYNDPKKPNLIPPRGAVFVTGGDASNPYGHTGVVLSSNANGMTVIQQNWDARATSPAEKRTIGYYAPGMGMITGWLIPRADKMAKDVVVVAPASTTTKTNQRKVGSYGVYERTAAKTSATAKRLFDPGTVLDFKGYVKGEKVSGTDVWFVGAYSGTYFHASGFTSQSVSGLKDLTPKPATSTKRTAVAAGANVRDTPEAKGKIVNTLAGGKSFTAKGYVVGDKVDGNANWIVSTSDNYVHVSALTNTSVSGLKKLSWSKPAPAPAPTPKPEPAPVPKPTPDPQPAPVTSIAKTVVSAGVNVRKLPYLDSEVVKTIVGGTKVTVTGYTVGDTSASSNVWFVTKEGYMHSSGLTSTATTGLTKKTAPAKPTQPAEGTYSFKPDFDFVEYKPAHITNVSKGDFPAKPTNVVIHQFDEKAKNPSIAGVISHFQTKRPGSESSAHFAVSGNRIVQLVSLKDRAYHAGAVGNNYIGIEVDPDEDDATVASVKKLLAAIQAKYGYMPGYVKHRDVPGNSTYCGGDIHLDLYKLSPDQKPAPTLPTTADKAAIMAYLERIVDGYLKSL